MRLKTLALLLLLSSTVYAETSVGVSVSAERFGSNSSKVSWRPVPGADVLLQGKYFGLHVAAEVAIPPGAETISILHTNLTYRLPLRDDLALSVGAGPTFIRTQSFGDRTPVNGEIELARRFARFDGYVGARHFEYDFDSFRGDCNACKSTVSLVAGVRYRLGGSGRSMPRAVTLWWR